MSKKKERIKNAQPDLPDSRDYLYEPALVELPPVLDPPGELLVLDQKYEGACTGFALAAAINMLNLRRGDATRVSPRMLYEMAKRFDEWPGERYDGSSLRGAIRGWKNMGVCAESKWRFLQNKPGNLTIMRAKDARRTTVGAYFRVKPRVSDFHAALNETGVVVVSALVHRGWDSPKRKIRFHKRRDGGHAFAIVGYDEQGFWVQNSWGEDWGAQGLALWSYEDWIKNVMDAWVFRLALPTPQIFGLRPESSVLIEDGGVAEKRKPTIDRSKIAGHFVHIDDGRFKETERYWSTKGDVEQTAEHVARSTKYDHLLVYAHGGLNSPKASARRIAALKEGFKRNRIYPFHLMYDTGLAEELGDLIRRKGKASRERVGGFSALSDRLLESLLRHPGTLVWDEMKRDAHKAFKGQGAGTVSLELFVKYLGAPAAVPKKIHLVGHSTGAILIAHLLRALEQFDLTLASCSLMAPACRLDLYQSHYLPVLRRKKALRIRNMQIYNLRGKLELDDNVMKAYRKSLLYLVSNAFERKRKRPLLGMEIFQSQVELAHGLPVFQLSNGISSSTTRSRSHGGFDNDARTMNHILKTVLNQQAPYPFKPEELDY